jgi:tRNA threonylcarbamoyladenosine biosynthesis protein TsaE
VNEVRSHKLSFPQTRVTNSASETVEVGEALGECLGAGDVVALYGELGSGKTTFTKGLAAGLGAMRGERVRSPTFVLLNLYKGRFPIYHVDLYRMETLERLHDIGYEDYAFGDGIMVIEWAEKAEQVLPETAIRVRLRTLGKTAREIRVEFPRGDHRVSV